MKRVCVLLAVGAVCVSAQTNMQKLKSTVAKRRSALERNLAPSDWLEGVLKGVVGSCPTPTCPEPVCNCGSTQQLDICEVYGNDKCGNHGDCVNTDTGFDCDCDRNYSGKHCELRDLCEDDEPCKHATKCTNMNLNADNEVIETTDFDETDLDDFYCSCESGWFGKRCAVDTDGYLDESPDKPDEDEISFVCPPMRIVGADGISRNQMGESGGKCVDINWCDEDRANHFACAQGETCVDHVQTSDMLERFGTAFFKSDGCEANTACFGRRCGSGYECEDVDLADATQSQQNRGWYCRAK